MKWTKLKPTKEGWYWYEDGLCDRPVIGKVQEESGILYFDDHCEISLRIGKGEESDETRWAGPIQEPT